MRLHPAWLALLAAGLAFEDVSAQTEAGWVVDFTWTYESRASRKRTGGQTGPAGTDTLVAASAEARVDAELRGSIEYTGRIQGAAATNMPDSRNSQRYDSWRSYWGSGGTKMAPSEMTVFVRVDEASRIGRSETYDHVNAARKGLIGRVRHSRAQVEGKLTAPGDLSFDGGDLQIDRVANTLTIVQGMRLEFDRKRFTPVFSYVERMDKPPAAGEWDRSGPDANGWGMMPKPSPEKLVFSIPPGADSFTVKRTFESTQLADPLETQLGPDWRDPSTVRDVQHRARETLTLVVRRREAPAAAAPAAAPAATTAAPPQSAAPQPAAGPSGSSESAAVPPAAQPPVVQPVQPPLPNPGDAIDAARRLRGLFGR